MQPTPKMQAAERTLLRRYLTERRELRKPGSYVPLQCTVKLDRIVIIAREVPLQALCAIPAYRAKPPRQLWRQLYRMATRILGTGSIKELIVESAPNVGWLPKFRVAIIPQDQTGLLFADLCLILELLSQFKIVLLELAVEKWRGRRDSNPRPLP